MGIIIWGYPQFSLSVFLLNSRNENGGQIMTRLTLIRYGLLGSSGCGKTTLLNCITGQRKVDCGELLGFCEEPGGVAARRRWITCHKNQDYVAIGELTIKEAIEYFGRIYDMASDFVNSQTKMLLKLLGLPEGSRRIRTLSGGQHCNEQLRQ